MLKGKGKAFAPKFKGRRPATAAGPSWDRPSVERSSQTPAPSLPVDVIVAPPPVTEPSAVEAGSSEVGHSHPAPPRFRPAPAEVPISQTQQESNDGPNTAEVPPRAEAQPLPPLSHAHPADVFDSTSNDGTGQTQKNLKRKERDQEPEVRQPHPPKRQALEISQKRAVTRSNNVVQTAGGHTATGLHAETTHKTATTTSRSGEVHEGAEPLGGDPLVNREDAAATPVQSDIRSPGTAVDTGQSSQQTIQAPRDTASASKGAAGASSEAVAPKTKKPKKKRAPKHLTFEGVDEGETRSEAETEAPKRMRSKTKRRKKGKRAATPDGAEDEEVDQTTTKMADLCKDIKIGKKFNKHDEIKQRTTQRNAKAKLAKTNPEVITLVDEPARDSAQPEPEDPTAAVSSGPQMRVVDGQIVIDNSSLQIDRHKRAEAEKVVLEEVEEDEFSRITTSGTLMKRERAQQWTREGEDLFYKGLRMFGTDFEMIAKMFPHRNRRQIKLKFNREERTNAGKITKALIGGKESIDLEEYTSMAGIELEDVANIEAERIRIETEQNAEQDKRASEVAEAAKKKKEAIQAVSDSARRILATADEPAGDSAKENDASSTREASAAPKSRKKVAPKKKRNPHTSRSGVGEEVEILGTIDRAG